MTYIKLACMFKVYATIKISGKKGHMRPWNTHLVPSQKQTSSSEADGFSPLFTDGFSNTY